jgi:phospholipid/cholesterol/gamma-HCH transport system substrate-binding protein
MTQRGDEVKVGVMVIATVALLLVTFFLMTNYNPFQSAGDEFIVRLKFAGGLEKDAAVRFGGVKRGKVTAVRLTPQSATAVEIALLLQPGTGVKTDSIARVASLGALGENYVEISPGQVSSPLLKPGQTIRSEETPAFSELFAKIDAMSVDAQKLIGDLNRNINEISGNANTLLTNLNETTGPRNRQNVAAALEGANGMIANANGLISSSSPKIEAITSNLQASTEKIDKLTSNIDTATTRMNKLLENVDSTVTENRPQLKKDVEVLEATLADLRTLLAQTTALLESNRGDINATLEELRRSSENLSQFTDSVKQRPYSLIRGTGIPDRKVPK